MTPRNLLIAAFGLTVAFGGATAAFAEPSAAPTAAVSQTAATPVKAPDVKMARAETDHKRFAERRHEGRHERRHARRLAMAKSHHGVKLAQAKSAHKDAKSVHSVG